MVRERGSLPESLSPFLSPSRPFLLASRPPPTDFELERLILLFSARPDSLKSSLASPLVRAVAEPLPAFLENSNVKRWNCHWLWGNFLFLPAMLQILRVPGWPVGKTRTIEVLGAGAIAPGKIRRGVGSRRDLFVRRPEDGGNKKSWIMQKLRRAQTCYTCRQDCHRDRHWR